VIVEVLRAHRKRQLAARLFAGDQWHESDLVFTTSRGTPFDGHNVTCYFKRILARLEMEPKRFHDLRHTAASLLLAQGVPLHEVSTILGHSGVQITADTYGHLYEQRRREIADRMDAFLRQAR
jgi:integrase